VIQIEHKHFKYLVLNTSPKMSSVHCDVVGQAAGSRLHPLADLWVTARDII